ncbi:MULTISPECIES: ABC transporter substrate-binding protein [Micromonospora]|uniref:ABC transporter substrate-binding protein n=1 Tax=Micromonospora TaxID=1873 RepID=UPI0013751798|nr:MULTISPECIES: ABC transporter substrate-binding protein [unclassified Micromonospora]MBM0226734.1 hypothetical protein [Micromonospora sp. ATA51]
MKTGGTVVFALSDEPDVLDPTLANTFVARVVFTSFCEKLYDADDKLNLVPQLAAELPKVSADALTVTIPLRKGVTFNDGTPFDAEAVKISLDRHRTLKGSARVKELAAVKTVTALDPATVQITLSRPFSPLGAQLADRAGLIMSPTALKKLGDKFGTSPVCVGPFKFESRTSGSEIRFTKSTNYYDADKVHLSGVTYRIVSDPNVRAANLQSGDVQAAERLAPTDALQLKSNPDVTLRDISAIGYQGLSINVGNVAGTAAPAGRVNTPLGRSPQLREALELSLDRDAMNKVVFAGQNAVDCLPLPLQSRFRPADAKCTPYDPERARQIVEASGEKLPIPVNLLVPARPADQKLAEVIQSMAKKVGFDVRIRQSEFVSSLAAARAGDFDAFLIGWSGRIDPDGNLGDLVGTGGSNNFGGLSDPAFDDLIKRGAQASDDAERQKIYTEALARNAQLRSIIYLYHERWFLGLSSKLTGVVYPGDGIARFKTAAFTG